MLLYICKLKTKIMAITETLTIHELTPSVTEAMTAIDGDYDTYWHQFGEQYGGDIQSAAERNQRKQTALTSRLYNPARQTGDRFVDSLDPTEVAEEWYMGIGSLNKLKGSSVSMLLAAATLWESPRANQLPDPNIATRFISEVGTIKRGQVPERMQRALSDQRALQRISLAGQAMLDIARVPEAEHIKEQIFSADLSFQINHAVFKLLVDRPVLSAEQQRVLSDSLKTQYDARLKYLELRKSRGEFSDSDYEASYNQTLAEQINDTLKAASKMTNGDLYEHYYIALMRYGLNTWQERTNYEVSSTTRRQDEPHDGFAPKNLPKFSYDAVIAEPDKDNVKLVQLKIKGFDSYYADGIDVLDDILADDATNEDMRGEILTGLNQMRGLMRELIIGDPYNGSDNVIRDHIGRILSRLNI